MRKRSILKALILLLVFLLSLTVIQTAAFAAAVSISQSGSTVTATNGNYTITYDLGTGKGNLSYGGTTVISNFYSDYNISGSSTRTYSYDSGTRTASWISIGNDAYGTGGYKLTITSNLNSGSVIVLNFYLYADVPFFLADMQVQKGTSQDVTFMEPIAANNLDIGSGSDKRILTAPYTNNNDFGVAPVNSFGTFDGTSYWVSCIFDSSNKKGFVAGAATVMGWKSMQYLAQSSSPNGPLSGFSVYNSGGAQSGTNVSSDKFFLGYYSDYRTGLEEFGTKYNTGESHMTWGGGVPVGYNSWYTLRSADLTAENMYPIVDYTANNLKSLGYNYVNLDAGWQQDDEYGSPDPVKWPVRIQGENPMKSFADYIHGKGLKAGIYLNPFNVSDALLDRVIPNTSYTFRQACLKDSLGNIIRTYIGTNTLDMTHPGALQYVRNRVQDFVNWGYDYIKIDFLDTALAEGNHYDSGKNGLQAYRLGMGAIKDTVVASGRSIYIDESIAPLLPNAFAHGRRSGCDTELGVDSYTGYERQAFNAVASWFSNGTIWQYNDGDTAMVDNYVGSGSNVYDKNQARLLMSAVTMAGGHWLVSENLPIVPDDKMAILKNSSLLSVALKGKAARPVNMTNFHWGTDHAPAVSYITDTNGDCIVNLSNWNDSAANIVVNFADIGLSSTATYYVSDLYKSVKVGTFTGSYTKSFSGKDSTIVRVSTADPSLPTAPANLSIGKTASASSVWGTGYEASKAIDGNMTTRWNSGVGQVNNQWLEINFGPNTTVNRVVVKEFYYYGYRINSYTLQYWNGSSYVNIKKGTTIGYEKEINFAPVTTSKIRLYINSASAEPSIWELEAYNVSGNTGAVIDQDDSDSTFSTYSDLRSQVQRMQVFKPSTATIPRIDVYAYKNGTPAGSLDIDIVSLDANYNPTATIFSATVIPVNFQTSLSAIPIYTNLTGLTANGNYGIILKSAKTADNGTNNCYGFGYNDSNPYANGFERLSTDGGLTWSTENSGARDLKFTVYK